MLEINSNNRKTFEGLIGGTPLCQERELSLLTQGRAAESIASSRVALKENDFKMQACGFTKECVQFDFVLSVIRSPGLLPTSLSRIQKQQGERQTCIWVTVVCAKHREDPAAGF
jgi:hypothetical protein